MKATKKPLPGRPQPSLKVTRDYYLMRAAQPGPESALWMQLADELSRRLNEKGSDEDVLLWEDTP